VKINKINIQQNYFLPAESSEKMLSMHSQPVSQQAANFKSFTRWLNHQQNLFLRAESWAKIIYHG
jgi:hypothetical protein